METERETTGWQEREWGKEDTIEARGPGIGGGRVACDMVEGVSMVDRVVETELGFKGFPEGDERRRRKERDGRGGVSGILDKVEVTTEEGGDRRVG